MDYNQAAEGFFSFIKKKESKAILLRLNEQAQGERLVLTYLYRNNGQSIVPSEIARFIGTSTARVANILNNLEEKGLVKREISRIDRRKILVSLTDKGRRETKRSRERIIGRINRIFQEMGENRTKSFISNWELFLEIGTKIIKVEEKEE